MPLPVAAPIVAPTMPMSTIDAAKRRQLPAWIREGKYIQRETDASVTNHKAVIRMPPRGIPNTGKSLCQVQKICVKMIPTYSVHVLGMPVCRNAVKSCEFPGIYVKNARLLIIIF